METSHTRSAPPRPFLNAFLSAPRLTRTLYRRPLPAGLTSTELQVLLVAFFAGEPVALSTVTQVLDLSASARSDALARLITLGYVTQAIGDDDRRERPMVISPPGRRLCNEFIQERWTSYDGRDA